MDAVAREQFERLERDHWWFRGRRAVYGEILRAALPRRVAFALDVGAGAGGFTAVLAPFAERVVALERDPGLARRAYGRGAAGVLVGTAERLPLADATCDLVVAFDVIEHLDDDGAALTDMRRVLAPDGLLAISVPAHPWLWSNNDRVSHHQRRYTRSGLIELVRAADLELVRATYANALLFPLIVPATLALKAGERLRLFGTAPRHTNLSLRTPRAFDALCYHAFAVERRWSRRHDLAVGHSLVALAKRRR